MNVVKFLRTLILMNIWERMLLRAFQYRIEVFFVISEETLISQN